MAGYMYKRYSLLLILILHMYALWLIVVSVLVEPPRAACSNATLSTSSLPLTALASFPGSGNTWCRHLLQQMTGILTGSVYNDLTLKNKGFPGEGRRDGRVVAIKTHHRYDESKQHYNRVLLLVRNPYETFLCDFTRQVSHSHTGLVQLAHFKGWRTFLKVELELYRKFHSSWMRHKRVFVLMYDKLKSNLEQELSRTKVFLDDENIPGNVGCAVDNPEGSFHRNTSGVPLEFFYQSEDRIMINKLIDELYEIFNRRFQTTHDNMMVWKL